MKKTKPGGEVLQENDNHVAEDTSVTQPDAGTNTPDVADADLQFDTADEANNDNDNAQDTPVDTKTEEPPAEYTPAPIASQPEEQRTNKQTDFVDYEEESFKEGAGYVLNCKVGWHGYGTGDCTEKTIGWNSKSNRIYSLRTKPYAKDPQNAVECWYKHDKVNAMTNGNHAHRASLEGLVKPP